MMSNNDSPPSSRIYFRALSKCDDAAVVDGVEDVSVPGEIELCFENRSSFFDAIQIRGNENQIIGAIDRESSQICGVAVRSTRNVYINGKERKAGYLSNLRINPAARNGRILAQGYAALKKLHLADNAELYTTTIVKGNTTATKLLTSGRCGLPHYNHYGNFYTAAITLLGRKKTLKLPADVEIQRGTVPMLEQIVACLNRNGRQKQFYPVYKRTDFEGAGAIAGMSVEDFYIASRRGKLIGVLGRWDQSLFKQVRVVRYRGKMQYLRHPFNLVAGLLNRAPLPSPGAVLQHFIVGFIAIDNDDPEIFRALLAAIYNDNLNAGFNYFAVGLHADDPLLGTIKGFSHTPFLSTMYVVNWPEQQDAFEALEKQRMPYLETGML